MADYTIFLRPPGERFDVNEAQEPDGYGYDVADMGANEYVHRSTGYPTAEAAFADAQAWVIGHDAVAEEIVGVPDDFAADFLALAQDNTRIPIELDKISAWQIFGALQLACRHPAFTGPSRATAEAFARGLQDRIATTPALTRVAEQGWHAEHDL